jgi:hypothetical protein
MLKLTISYGNKMNKAIMALDGAKSSTSHPCRFISGKRAPDIHLLGGRAGTKAGVEELEKKSFPVPASP